MQKSWSPWGAFCVCAFPNNKALIPTKNFSKTSDKQVKLYRSSLNELKPNCPWEDLNDSIEVDEYFSPSVIKVSYAISHDFLYDLSVRLKRGEQEIILFDRKPKGNLSSIVDKVNVPQLTQQNAHGDGPLLLSTIPTVRPSIHDSIKVCITIHDLNDIHRQS